MTGNALIEASSGNIGIYRGIPIAYGQSSPELPRSRQRENQGRSLDPQKKPQENSYRIFYSPKYIPYTHSTCRIYSLLVPGILESRMSQETASVLGNSYRIFYSLKYIPYTRGYVGSISISAERILK